ncbi:MAG TPA: hypothetical protein PL149_09395 [Candidatus Kapabacteria bacterium]|nr:hypothetical protein [Candidatus Kapabacteria bacterium]
MRNIKSFSFILLLVFVFANLLNSALNLNLGNIFLLNPKEISHNYYFWQLITYPFVLKDNLFIFILAPILILLSTKLENYLNKYLYPIFLFMVSILNGLLITLSLWNKDINISGSETVGFFILTLVTLIMPKERLSRKNPLTVSTFAILIASLWIMINYVAHPQQLYNTFPIMFGVLSGFLVYIPIRNMRKYIEKREFEINSSKQRQVKINIPEPEEIVAARKISNVNISQIYHKYEEDYCELSDNEEENEEKLNQILDKINEKGKESLSYYEKKFLNEYSKRIK